MSVKNQYKSGELVDFYGDVGQVSSDVGQLPKTHTLVVQTRLHKLVKGRYHTFHVGHGTFKLRRLGLWIKSTRHIRYERADGWEGL